MRIITVARKPLSESTVTKNVLTHGTGAINIDATRIPYGDDEEPKSTVQVPRTTMAAYGDYLTGSVYHPHEEGRWPSNMILCHKPGCSEAGCVVDCPVPDLDRQSPGASRCFKQVR